MVAPAAAPAAALPGAAREVHVGRLEPAPPTAISRAVRLFPAPPAPEAIEEDDEFEEFKEEGECFASSRESRARGAIGSHACSHRTPLHDTHFSPLADWGKEQSSHAAAEEWAEDWDDEDAETDFDKVLRAELEKAAAAAAAAK